MIVFHREMKREKKNKENSRNRNNKTEKNLVDDSSSIRAFYLYSKKIFLKIVFFFLWFFFQIKINKKIQDYKESRVKNSNEMMTFPLVGLTDNVCGIFYDFIGKTFPTDFLCCLFVTHKNTPSRFNNSIIRYIFRILFSHAKTVIIYVQLIWFKGSRKPSNFIIKNH